MANAFFDFMIHSIGNWAAFFTKQAGANDHFPKIQSDRVPKWDSPITGGRVPVSGGPVIHIAKF